MFFLFLGWIFALFGGSNNTQISMFGVKWLRDLTTRGAWLLWGQAPLVVGFLNHFAQNFRFWGTFRPKQGARSASCIISRTTESILVTKNKSDYSWCPKCTQKGGGAPILDLVLKQACRWVTGIEEEDLLYCYSEFICWKTTSWQCLL